MAKSARFTDRQKKNMVAAYVREGNYCAVARKYGCSEAYVRKIVAKNPDVANLCEEEKKKNCISVREHMKKQSAHVCRLLDRLLDEIGAEEKLSDAPIRELATVLGILADKYAAIGEEKESAGGGVIVLPVAELISDEELKDLHGKGEEDNG